MTDVIIYIFLLIPGHGAFGHIYIIRPLFYMLNPKLAFQFTFISLVSPETLTQTRQTGTVTGVY